MVTAKCNAIWRIIRSKHFLLFHIKTDGDVTYYGAGRGTLAEMMALAINLKGVSSDMAQHIENQAAEKGELHTLMGLRNAIEKIEKETNEFKQSDKTDSSSSE